MGIDCEEHRRDFVLEDRDLSGGKEGNYYLLALNREGSWNVEGPYNYTGAKWEFEKHMRVMPNCPCKLVRLEVTGAYVPTIQVA